MGSLFKSTRNTRALPGCGFRYIRSDYPGALTEDEINWLIAHDVTTVVDLREAREYEQEPCVLEQLPQFRYYHLPVTGGGGTPTSPEAVAQVYVSMLDEQMETIVKTLMEAPANTLYFCGAGKDRTGVVSAVILKRLGYGDEEIVADYMETKDNLMDFLIGYVRAHPEVDLRTIVPNEQNIRAVLKRL